MDDYKYRTGLVRERLDAGCTPYAVHGDGLQVIKQTQLDKPVWATRVLAYQPLENRLVCDSRSQPAFIILRPDETKEPSYPIYCAKDLKNLK